jgi:putative membrane-bound dehydrogenase-like protein
MRWLCLVLLVLCGGSFGAEPEPDPGELPRIPPTEPAKALATFKVKPGFRVELAAAEPNVRDPVALSFDEYGRMYVVEMRDYSERRDERLGTVRLLEDANNDGTFEKSTVFADNLPWPTAVICYDGGIFVASSPDILFLRDTDGDRKADERRVVFTGFGKGVERLNVQALPNSFNWTLDNRIHGATGPNGGQITRDDAPQIAPVELRGRDFSFDPRTLEFRAETGGSQHGLTFDNYGRKFVCNNSTHIQTLMYEERYAARNTVYSLPRALIDIAVDGGAAPVYRISRDEPWRVIRTQWRVAGKVPGPIEGGGRPSGYFTSATGVTIYRGDAYGADFAGDAFIGDCGSNLVHRKKVRPRGVELVAERPHDEPKTEFLASTDNWFRPVQFANAPDGCLYVLDMYREVIEHPWSLPPGIKKHLDLNSGNDRGRIYRIVPQNFKRRRAPNLGRASTRQLVETLGHPNGWHRDTAARLLFERLDESAADPLLVTLKSSTNALARLHALYALAGLLGVTRADVVFALRDESPIVREHAIRVCELFNYHLQAELVRLADDSDARVRYQLAWSLGAFGDLAHTAAARVLRRDVRDPWIRAAVLSSVDTPVTRQGWPIILLQDVWDLPDAPLAELATLIGAYAERNWMIQEALTRAFRAGSRSFTTVRALGNGLQRSGKTLREFGSDFMDDVNQQAAEVAADPRHGTKLRIEAIEVLAFADYDLASKTLLPLLPTNSTPEVQIAALRTLGRFRDHDLAAALLPLLPNMAHRARTEALGVLMTRAKWIAGLLDALAANRIPKSTLTPQHIQSLVNHSDPAVYRRAREVFNVATNSERESIIQKLMPATQMQGNVASGRKIYTERCAACHRFGNEGNAVGPDIVAMKTSGKEKLLVNIIDPNREVAPNLQTYSVETTDGETITGLLLKDSGGSVTLTTGGGSEITLIRAQVRKLTPQGKSLMPEGFEEGLTLKQIADLLEFLSAPDGK